MSYIIFDWKRTLYDPESRNLITGSLEILDSLKSRNIATVLIGKGDADMYDEVDRLKVRDYFKDVVFREGTKDSELFTPFVDMKNPKSSIFIGDRVHSELAVGNQLGATTIWVKQGKFADELPDAEDQQPTYTVSSLSEAQKLLEDILSHN